MGILIAAVVITLWGGHLAWALVSVAADVRNPLTYLHVLFQAYLYTGLFITAHDSMHGSITRRRPLNRVIGQISLWLFAAFRYQPMFTKHMAHHRNPGTSEDPDFSVRFQDPFRWFFRFFLNYVTILQLATMAILFNIGRYLVGIDLANLIAFWVIPAFLGTFQLFFFGTYLPHRYPHTADMAPHNSRTLRRNHLWAMLSCWFFGYHWEHHEHPRTPWWLLYRTTPPRMKADVPADG